MVEREHAILRDEPKFEALPQGVYTAEIVDIQYKRGLQTKYGLKNKYYVYMGILDERARAKKIVHFVNDTYYSGANGGQASKLYEFVNAIIQEPIIGDFDINSLIKAKVQIVVKQTTVDGRTNSNITSVLSPELSNNLKSLSDGERNSCMPKKDIDFPSDVSTEDANHIEGKEDVKSTEIPF
jgi:hypothetical protein